MALHVLDPAAARSYATTLAVLACVRSLYPKDFAWLPPPFEYETVKMPIDILAGSDELRESLDADRTAPADVQRLAELDGDDWLGRSRPFRLYS